jgi:hypothetical protein
MGKPGAGWPALIAMALAAAPPLAAQGPHDAYGSRAPFVWLDVGVGPTMTGGGDYAYNGSLGGQATLNLRLPHGMQAEGSVFGSGRGRWFGSCLASGTVGARACAGFPAVTGWSAGLALGSVGTRQQLAAHLGLGAGRYRLRQPWTGEVARVTGFHLSLGGATPVWSHIAVASEMRIIVLPQVFGRTHWVVPLTFGARVW